LARINALGEADCTKKGPQGSLRTTKFAEGQATQKPSSEMGRFELCAVSGVMFNLIPTASIKGHGSSLEAECRIVWSECTQGIQSINSTGSIAQGELRLGQKELYVASQLNPIIQPQKACSNLRPAPLGSQPLGISQRNLNVHWPKLVDIKGYTNASLKERLGR
jgi:hypothetical protein